MKESQSRGYMLGNIDGSQVAQDVNRRVFHRNGKHENKIQQTTFLQYQFPGEEQHTGKKSEFYKLGDMGKRSVYVRVLKRKSHCGMLPACCMIQDKERMEGILGQKWGKCNTDSTNYRREVSIL
jgi:hypothetical protein